MSKIHEVYWAINNLQGHPSQEDWKDHLKLVQSWVAATLNSITARVGLAQAYIDYAWEARGGETGDTVTNSGWKLFGQRLEQAKATLDEASALPSQCPELYGVSLANLNRLALMATKSKDSLVQTAPLNGSARAGTSKRGPRRFISIRTRHGPLKSLPPKPAPEGFFKKPPLTCKVREAPSTRRTWSKLCCR
jgi:hypothetical protein